MGNSCSCHSSKKVYTGSPYRKTGSENRLRHSCGIHVSNTDILLAWKKFKVIFLLSKGGNPTLHINHFLFLCWLAEPSLYDINVQKIHIITINYSLINFGKYSPFLCFQQFCCLFPWFIGTEVYLIVLRPIPMPLG